MNKLLRILGVVLLLAMIASPASATRGMPDREVPLRGSVLGTHGIEVPPTGCEEGALWRFFSDGTGTMSHLGRVAYELSQCSYPSDRGPVYAGTITFTAANGDTLLVAHAGTSEVVGELPEPDGFTLDATWVVVGGTGRFAGATGTGVLEGVGDVPGGEALFGLPDGYARLDLAGGIAYDASARTR